MATLSGGKNEVEGSRDKIEKMVRELKEVEGERMEDMFAGKVSNPYVATNKNGNEVDPSSIFSSYMLYLKTKM